MRTEAIVNEARRKSAGIANPILFVREGGEAPYKVHIDAMLAARQLGWPTANGYSGNQVPGYEYQPTCDTPARQIAAYQSWRHLHHVGQEIRADDFLNRLVSVGWPDCNPGKDSPDRAEAGLGPLPDPATAQFVSLVPLSLEKRTSQLVFEIAIRNKGDTAISARSFYPVRAAWRFVEAGTELEKSKGWDTRFQISKNIFPNNDLNVTLSADLPKKRGDYRLEVSLVAEHSFWFHDKGMGILQFPQVVTVQ
jgi:hypothetical protein